MTNVYPSVSERLRNVGLSRFGAWLDRRTLDIAQKHRDSGLLTALYCERARRASRRGDFAHAQMILSEAMKLEPEDVSVFTFQLGTLATDHQRWEDAIPAFESTLAALDPDASAEFRGWLEGELQKARRLRERENR